MLRDTKFRISRGHPREITRARKTLWPDLKQAKALNPSAKVAILYPAKLVVNGRVVKDLSVQEPVLGLIKWLRPKGLKVYSYVEKCAEFKNQIVKKIGWYTKVLCATEYPRGMQYLKIALKWGYPCRCILKPMLYK